MNFWTQTMFDHPHFLIWSQMAVLLFFLLTSASMTLASLTPPLIRPTSWTAADDFNWDSSVEVPKGPGSRRNVLVIPSTVDGLVLSCNASYPVEWIFHHSQLPSHYVQRSSRGRWRTTISTTRKSDDLNDPKTFEYIADIRFMGSTNGITGNYTCQKVGDEFVSRSVYLYWEATSPPFLIQQGQNATAVLDPATNTTLIVCTVARPDIKVKLLKAGIVNGTTTWTELKQEGPVSYDPKIGFKLSNLPNPIGQYKCIANSDEKDWATAYVVPSTSPEAKPLEFGDVVKRPARYGYDKTTLQLFCCAYPDSPAPNMMHFYCDHPTSCRNRRNALLYMENTSTRNGSCSSLRLFTQIAGVFRCVGDGIDIVREYFFPMGTQFGFGGMMNRNRTPADPYYNWEKADPTKMISLRVWVNKIYVGQNVTFGCQVSNYYFSRGARWVLGLTNGTQITIKEALRNTSGTGGHGIFQNFRRNINNLVVTADLSLASVSCYAPVWNTSEWKSQSLQVKVQVPTKPSVVGGDTEATVVEWYVNDTQKYFDCDATGEPAPQISWKKDGRRFYRYTTIKTNDSSSRTVSRINITRVSYETHGDYICTVKNLAGTITKTFKVIVHERTSMGATATIVISIVCLVMAVGGLIYLVIRIKNQKVIINKLAASSFNASTSPDTSAHVTPDPRLAYGNVVEVEDETNKRNDGNYRRM